MVHRISNYPSPFDLNRRVLSYAFQSDRSYAQWKLGITYSGDTNMSIIQIKLDNNTLEWLKSQGNFSSGDKLLYSWIGPKGLATVRHSLVIKSLYPIITTDSALNQEVRSVGNCKQLSNDLI